MIAISLNIANGRCRPEQLMPRLKAAGFDGLDFNFSDQWAGLPQTSEPTIDAWLASLAESAEAENLKWVQSHGPFFNVLGDTPQDRAGRELCRQAIACSGRLGVPWMVLHPGTAIGAWDRSHRRAVLRANAEFVRSLLPLCERHNVGIALENIPFDRQTPYRFSALPEDLCELADELSHPLVGICWDTGHGRIIQVDQRSAIASLGSRLKVIHVQDNDGRGDNHLLPFAVGKAGIDWRGVMAGLKESGFSGPFSFEVHHAFSAVPDELLDGALGHAVNIARYLLAMN